MVDRFQVMGIFQAARARKLGLSLWSAKSFGLNRAIFYRAAKFGFNRTIPREYKTKISKERSIPYDEREKINKTFRVAKVGDESAFAVKYKNKLTFIVGNKLIKPSDFERAIESKFGDDFDWAWEETLAIVSSYESKVLKSQRLFYETVYKPRRDSWAKKWSDRVSPQRLKRVEVPEGYVFAHEISRKRRVKKVP